MATADVTNPLGIVELAKRTSGQRMLVIANPLAKIHDAMNDAVWGEANNPGFHVHNRTVALPSGTWRGINEGSAGTAGQTKQITETIGLYEALNPIDEALIKLASDPIMFRMQEDKLFLEGMGNGFMSGIFYNDKTATPQAFNGLFSRDEYNALSAANVSGGGGTGSNTMSIVIIEWGYDGVWFAYPAGRPNSAIHMMDNGRQSKLDSNSRKFYVYETQFDINAALIIRDDRAVQRCANIATSGATNIFNPDLIYDMISRLPHKGANAIGYVNRTGYAQMLKNANSKTNAFYMGPDVYRGREVPHIGGIPFHMDEALLTTETAIT